MRAGRSAGTRAQALPAQPNICRGVLPRSAPKQPWRNRCGMPRASYVSPKAAIRAGGPPNLTEAAVVACGLGPGSVATK
jgi:hypothetical protein